ncbi:MAG: ATP-binding cassette domain-containing protein [Candidatus Cloacimonetes bacterium]|nr:ATP-binding cassette domain-containing protein [Candidatus Cloacimonadota bacterium]
MFDIKEVDEELKKTIDMVTRLYVFILRAEGGISLQEINILHSLLVNLFKYVDISWEVYVRDIISSEYTLVDVIEYLKAKLNHIDKVRIILSLIIMVKSDNDFQVSEITQILELCKKLDLDTEGFISLINHFDYNSLDTVSIPYAQNISTIHNSIFTDYILWGKDQSCDIRYRNTKLAPIEIFLISIGEHLFIGTSSYTTAVLNDKKMLSNSLYLLAPDSILSIGELDYDVDLLSKIYAAKDVEDDIVFSKQIYEFIIKNKNNRYEISVSKGTVYQNGKQLLTGRSYKVYHDDVLQIQGFSPFHLSNVIRERSQIGVEAELPSELYIFFDAGFYSISRTEANNSITMLEIRDKEVYVYPPKRGWELYVNEEKIKDIRPVNLNRDIFMIKKFRFRINQYLEIVEIPFELDTFSVLDIKHYFKDGQLALDSISFEAHKGELIGILGQSGSGKSTLLKILCAEMIPTYGEIKIDNKSFFGNTGFYSQFIGYVPQDDLLYPNLTVYENLWYRGRLRMQGLSRQHLDQKITNILRQVNLLHRKDMQVGDYKKKLLSGGERKRLNIALELLFEPTIIICDEPTSGLSHNDALQIINILKNLCEQGKIVILSIHQPSTSVFQRFDKTLLMDFGGKQAFYGSVQECFSFFDQELVMLGHHREEIEAKKLSFAADYMYDVISYPEYNDKGEPVYEQVNKVLLEKRKFPPEYWRDKFKRKMLYEIIQQDKTTEPKIPPPKKKRSRKVDFRSQALQLYSFLERSFKMKLRNRTNNFITFLEAPLLALVISFILRLSPDNQNYSYNQNINIGIFIFVSVIAFVFLGMSNSIEEVLDERKIVLREKMMNLRMSYYQLSKLISLSFFAFIQVLMYYLVSALILDIRGLGGISILYFFMSSAIGFSLGLLVSSFIKDNKSIINLLPLILIPQIIFGGAVIEFERMNRSLKISERNPIPEVVQLIPSRWLFEGLVAGYAKNTLYYRKLDETRKKGLTHLDRYKENEISRSEFIRLKSENDFAKAEIARKWSTERYNNEYLDMSVSLMDGRFLSSGTNVFLSSYKRIGEVRMRTWHYCLFVLLFYIMLFNIITLIKLKYLE